MDTASSSGGQAPTVKKAIPGAVDVQVSYTVVDLDFQIDYQAVADAPTHINLTQHSYFNLARPEKCWRIACDQRRARTFPSTSR
jgi:galactose mutarotase-like enzyme